MPHSSLCEPFRPEARTIRRQWRVPSAEKLAADRLHRENLGSKRGSGWSVDSGRPERGVPETKARCGAEGTRSAPRHVSFPVMTPRLLALDVFDRAVASHANLSAPVAVPPVGRHESNHYARTVGPIPIDFECWTATVRPRRLGGQASEFRAVGGRWVRRRGSASDAILQGDEITGDGRLRATCGRCRPRCNHDKQPNPSTHMPPLDWYVNRHRRRFSGYRSRSLCQHRICRASPS